MKEMYKGFEIEILQDEIAESPRDWDNLGILAVVQNRYVDGDEIVTEDTVTDILNDEDLIALPVYAYVHGSVRLGTEGFADRFDSGMVGVIYISIAKAQLEYTSSYSEDIVKQVLKGEVETYSKYLSGDVLGYVIKHNGEVLDSCYGFYDDPDSVLSQAKEAADCIPIESCSVIVPDNNSGIGKEGCHGLNGF